MKFFLGDGMNFRGWFEFLGNENLGKFFLGDEIDFFGDEKAPRYRYLIVINDPLDKND